MGLRVKRYGPLSTMVVVGRLVGMFVPALVMVSMAQMASARARTNTTAPNKPAGQSSGRNGKGSSQSRANPATTASAQASGGRIKTRAVSWVISLILRQLPFAKGRLISVCLYHGDETC